MERFVITTELPDTPLGDLEAAFADTEAALDCARLCIRELATTPRGLEEQLSSLCGRTVTLDELDGRVHLAVVGKEASGWLVKIGFAAKDSSRPAIGFTVVKNP